MVADSLALAIQGQNLSQHYSFDGLEETSTEGMEEGMYVLWVLQRRK